MKNKVSLTNQTIPKRNEVWKMFDRIAHRYDLLNRMLSFGQDVIWRKRISRYLPNAPDLWVLDLATGTGDMLISIYKNSGKIIAGIGLDMAGEMLKLADLKIIRKKLNNALWVVRGDATRLPFADNSFDAVTIAFGIRNIEDCMSALSEMQRTLKPNGRVLILEFSLPKNRVLRGMYLLYFRYFVPIVGALVSSDDYAYKYLNQTVETYPYGEEFCQLMEEAGFTDVKAYPQTFGIATIYQGSCKHVFQQGLD